MAVVDYNNMTKAELIAELQKRDAEIEALKADVDTPVILDTKIRKLQEDKTELMRKMQELPKRGGLSELERAILTDGLKNKVNEIDAELTKLKDLRAKL